MFEVDTTNAVDWDDLRRVGAEFEHESIIMLGSKVFSLSFFVRPPPHSPHPCQDTRSTFEKPPDALLVATLPDVVRCLATTPSKKMQPIFCYTYSMTSIRSARSPQSKSRLH